ncbi:MAG: hypothetical protein ACRDP5_06705 [Streptosporangiaceae bacterium]
MSKPHEPLTLGALLAMPPVLDYATSCLALGISESQGYKLIATAAFPVAPLPHSGPKRLYALADVLRYLGMDPAMVAAPPVPEAPAA